MFKVRRGSRASRVGFFLSAWLTFLVICYMVFEGAGLFSESMQQDFVPYLSFGLVAVVVGLFLWIFSGRVVEKGGFRMF